MTESAASTCPHCGAQIEMVDRSLAGQQITCSSCNQTMVVSKALESEVMPNSESLVATPAVEGPPLSTKSSGRRFSLLSGIIAMLVLAGIGLAVWNASRPHASSQSIDFA